MRNESEQVPPAFPTVSVTGYVPAAVYVCEGFWLVEVFPSPKFQLNVEPPVEVFVKLTANGTEQPCVTLEVKLTIGKGFTVIVLVAEPLQPFASVAFMVTVYVPAVAYVYVAFVVAAVPPSPKVQLVLTEAGADEFVKVTLLPSQTVVVEALKLATISLIITLLLIATESEQPPCVIISVTL